MTNLQPNILALLDALAAATTPKQKKAIKYRIKRLEKAAKRENKKRLKQLTLTDIQGDIYGK